MKSIVSLAFFRVRRITRRAIEVGRRRERKEWKKKLKEKQEALRHEMNADLTQKMIHMQEKINQAEREKKVNLSEYNKSLAELRTAQATQINLIRKVYKTKINHAERMIEANSKKELDLNARHYQINDYLSRFTVELEKAHARKENQVKEKAVESLELDILKNAIHGFSTILENQATNQNHQRIPSTMKRLGMKENL